MKDSWEEDYVFSNTDIANIKQEPESPRDDSHSDDEINSEEDCKVGVKIKAEPDEAENKIIVKRELDLSKVKKEVDISNVKQEDVEVKTEVSEEQNRKRRYLKRTREVKDKKDDDNNTRVRTTSSSSSLSSKDNR